MRRYSLKSRAKQLCFGHRGELYFLDSLGNTWVCSLQFEEAFPLLQLRSTLNNESSRLKTSNDGRWLLYQNFEYSLSVLFSLEDQNEIVPTTLTDSLTWEENLGLAILMPWYQEAIPKGWFETEYVDFVGNNRYLLEIILDYNQEFRFWDLVFHTKQIKENLPIGLRPIPPGLVVLPNQNRFVFPQPMDDYYWVVSFPELEVVGSFYIAEKFVWPGHVVGQGNEVYFAISRHRAIALAPEKFDRIGGFPFPQPVECLAVNRDQTVLLTGHKRPNLVRQWKIPTGLQEPWVEMNSWDWEIGSPESLSIDPSGTMAAVSGVRKKIVIFDLET